MPLVPEMHKILPETAKNVLQVNAAIQSYKPVFLMSRALYFLKPLRLWEKMNLYYSVRPGPPVSRQALR